MRPLSNEKHPPLSSIVLLRAPLRSRGHHGDDRSKERSLNIQAGPIPFLKSPVSSSQVYKG